MNDFDNALEKLKQMLSTDEGRNSLGSLVGSMSGGNEYTPAVSAPADADSSPNPFRALQSQGAPRHSLLSALQPYLSSKRRGKFDVALRILQIAQFTSLTKGPPIG